MVRQGPGHTVARLTTGPQHANPHGTVHGAVFYGVAGAAVAAAANDAEHSGIITSVLVEYLRPAAIGDQLHAEVAARGVDRARGHLHRHRTARSQGAPAGLGPRPWDQASPRLRLGPT